MKIFSHKTVILLFLSGSKMWILKSFIFRGLWRKRKKLASIVTKSWPPPPLSCECDKWTAPDSSSSSFYPLAIKNSFLIFCDWVIEADRKSTQVAFLLTENRSRKKNLWHKTKNIPRSIKITQGFFLFTIDFFYKQSYTSLV